MDGRQIDRTAGREEEWERERKKGRKRDRQMSLNLWVAQWNKVIDNS